MKYIVESTAPAILPPKVINIAQYKEPVKKASIPPQPLIEEEIIQAITFLATKPNRFKGCNISQRNYTMFLLNINIGLRCGDLLGLKISDVMADGKIKDSIVIAEGKTDKVREMFLYEEVKQALYLYITSMEGWQYDWYLFHVLFPRQTPYRTMSRKNVECTIMKSIQTELKLNVPINTHSMRKTWARFKYDELLEKGDYIGLQQLQDALGHSSERITRRYIGLQREDMRKLYTSKMVGQFVPDVYSNDEY